MWAGTAATSISVRVAGLQGVQDPLGRHAPNCTSRSLRPRRNNRELQFGEKRLSAVLGRAFYDDPVTTWMLPDPVARKAKLHKLFGALTRYHHLRGGGVEVATEGGRIGAAALWDPPGRRQHTRHEELLALPRLLWTFGRQLAKAAVLDELMTTVHPEEPHWYLAVIGSDPTVRGARPRACADAFAAGPGRCRARTGLPGIQQYREYPVLLPVRVRGHRRNRAARRAPRCGPCGGRRAELRHRPDQLQE